MRTEATALSTNQPAGHHVHYPVKNFENYSMQISGLGQNPSNTNIWQMPLYKK
jgi:hypothetical protein